MEFSCVAHVFLRGTPTGKHRPTLFYHLDSPQWTVPYINHLMHDGNFMYRLF
jgi:hypothetical protein